MLNSVLITGATGYLGRFFLDAVEKAGDIEFALLVRNKATINKELGERGAVLEVNELFSDTTVLRRFSAIVHLAFARTWEGADLADSLTFTKELAAVAKVSRCSFMNISSRSVYGSGSENGRPWCETTSVAKPETTYALAKFASEEVVSAIYESCEDAYFTNIRLGSLAGFDFNQRIVSRFVDRVISQQPIVVKAPDNMFSFLDVRDAAEGILSLLRRPSRKWATIYNLGIDRAVSLIGLAQIVNDRANNYGYSSVKIVVEDGVANNFDLMDSKRIQEDTDWHPSFDYVDIVDSIYKFKIGK